MRNMLKHGMLQENYTDIMQAMADTSTKEII